MTRARARVCDGKAIKYNIKNIQGEAEESKEREDGGKDGEKTRGLGGED